MLGCDSDGIPYIGCTSEFTDPGANPRNTQSSEHPIAGAAFGDLRARAAESVALKVQNGIYVVPVVINGRIAPEFVVDTGSADVLGPEEVFSTLFASARSSRTICRAKQSYFHTS
jgi:hypothetical protein